MIIESPILVPVVPSVTYEPPKIFFTVHSASGAPSLQNPLSAKVVAMIGSIHRGNGISGRVFTSIDHARSVVGPHSVAIFDYSYHIGHFSPRETDTVAAPEWAWGTYWSVLVKPECGKNETRLERCASQVSTMFGEDIFLARIRDQNFPWGVPKRGAVGPAEKVIIDPVLIDRIVSSLNSGPNLAEAIADRAFAAELPKNSKISWVRVLPEPLGYSADMMQCIVTAMRRFEQVSHRLLGQDASVERVILSGVTLREERLRDLYINPGVQCFSVARPDLHWTLAGLNASENDEMPGGMPELVLLDLAYGLNAERWKRFFDWLTSSGPLLFLVSHEWSKCYVPEVTWLVGHLVRLGYDARLLLTDRLHELTVESGGVYHRGTRIGAIWRQFPIFETAGKLADLVELARAGAVRIYPEWAHFGNKSWFYLFWKYQEWFSANLSPDDFGFLRSILPESYFIDSESRGDRGFPIRVGGISIESIHELRTLQEAARDQLVMKICGANSLASRSHGVLMGKGLKDSDWTDWVDARLRAREPFLVQAMFNPGVVSVPVWNTGTGVAEMFRCKVLMRPWVQNGEVISVHACAVPRQFHKVHGMVSMAVSPVRLV